MTTIRASPLPANMSTKWLPSNRVTDQPKNIKYSLDGAVELDQSYRTIVDLDQKYDERAIFAGVISEMNFPLTLGSSATRLNLCFHFICFLVLGIQIF